MPKFLILRFSSIGDIVLTTPVIRCLKQQVKNAEVHFATKLHFKSILEYNPYVDKLHVLNDGLNNFIDELKKEKFDYVIDLHHNQRTAWIKFRLGAKSFSFDKLNWEKFLITNFKINKLPHVHIVGRYMETLKSLGVTNDEKGLDYFMPEHISHNFKFPFEKNNYIAFAIGAQHATKRLPTQKIISLSKKINQNIILLGGKEDISRGKEIASNAGEKVFNACGKYSLHESALIIKHSKHVITHDTGLMHIASAFHKNISSIWGNTIPEFGMTPYFGEKSSEGFAALIEVKNLSCRPCSKLGYDKCPKGHFDCMNKIDEEVVVKSLEL